MTDDKTIATPTPPVILTVVGTGDGLVSGTTAVTPTSQPNVVLRVIRPLAALANRFAFTFGGQIVGLLTAAMTPDGAKILYTGDFWHLLVTCASLSLPWAVYSLIKDLVTMSKNLENRFPLLTGNA